MVPALPSAPLSQVLFQSIMFKTSNKTLCSGSGPSFLHLRSLHVSGKWDVSLLSKWGETDAGEFLQTICCRLIVSYWTLNTKQIQLLLCSKIALGSLFIVCLFGRGKFHHDNHSLVFNTVHVWLQKQSTDFKVKTLTALEVLSSARYI